jgi:SAM-dependent methyltransferase
MSALEEKTAIESEGFLPEDFLEYYEIAATRGTDKLLLEALKIVEEDTRIKTPGDAVDLGCGIGRDTAELLRRGWRVLAIDYCREGIAALLKRPEATRYSDYLRARVSSFARETWTKKTLVVALLSLPYCPADEFEKVWAYVVRSVRSGGYLVCHLFGDKEKEPGGEKARRFSREEVDSLLSDLEVVKLEDNHDTERGLHYYSIIARRRQNRRRRRTHRPHDVAC